jgi:beta-carotene hydroxylase
MPPLAELGPDLVRVTQRQRLTSLALPFGYCAAYFAFAAAGWWPAAVVALVGLSFVTYGSTSHDLVHRNLGLSPRVNDLWLSLIELLALRSGHAYRAAHLHHHARFPAEDDVEATAARKSWLGAVAEGFTFQARIWWWAVRRGGPKTGWVVAEGIACVVLIGAAVAAAGVTPVFAAYAALMVAGGWVIPLVTSYLTHDPTGADELSQTRLFRGRTASVLGLGHLYHLEHHIYPAVPHHRWPELARRLDPYFRAAGVRPVTFWR